MSKISKRKSYMKIKKLYFMNIKYLKILQSNYFNFEKKNYEKFVSHRVKINLRILTEHQNLTSTQDCLYVY